MKYLALLRGINVGGNNLIKKEDLKKCFEDCGFESVKTYIQSGNILFKSDLKGNKKIASMISDSLKIKLENEIKVVVYSESEYYSLLDCAHKIWGHDEAYKHNALFVLDDSSKKDIEADMPETDGRIDIVTVVDVAIFWSSLKDKYSKSAYSQKLIKTPIYKKVTIRNSNTSFKLKDLFSDI